MKKKIIRLSLVLLGFSCQTAWGLGNAGSFTAVPSHNKIVLQWKNPDGFVQTEIFRSRINYPATITEGVQMYVGTGTTYTDTGVINGLTYFYTAFAFDGSSSYSLAVPEAQGSATPSLDISPPSPPGTPIEGLPDVDVTTSGTYTVYWSQAIDSESSILRYKLQEQVDSGNWITISENIPAWVGSYSIINAIPAHCYSYRLSAQNEAGLWSNYSPASDGIWVVNKYAQVPASLSYSDSYSELTAVDVPGTAFATPAIFTISHLSVPSTDLQKASPPISKILVASARKLLAIDANNTEIFPSGSITVDFSYNDSEPGNELADLNYRIYWLDGDIWQALATQTVNTRYNLISATIKGAISTYIIAEPADFIPPGPATGFGAKAQEKAIKLTWTNPADKDFVCTEIIRSTLQFPGSPTDGIRRYSGPATSFVDTDVIPGQLYYYTGFAYDGKNYSMATPSAQATATLSVDTTPPLPGTITESRPDIDGITTGNYTVYWTQATDEESAIIAYELQEKKNSDNWQVINASIPPYYDSCSFVGKIVGDTYQYRIRAKNRAGLWSNWAESDGIRVVSAAYQLPATSDLIYKWGDEEVRAEVPNNAFVSSFTFTMARLPDLTTAQLMAAQPKIKGTITSIWQLQALTPDNIKQEPAVEITLTLYYPDNAAEEGSYIVYYLNESTSKWEAVPGSHVINQDRGANMFRLRLSKLGTFIIAKPFSSAGNLDNVKIYPNPFKPGQGHNTIKLENLPDNVALRIYKLTGELVYEKEFLHTGGIEEWDVTNSSGTSLASGVYIYVLQSASHKITGKIAVLR